MKSVGLLIGSLILLAPVQARADWRDAVKGVRIGIVAADNPLLAIDRMKPFADHLETTLRIGAEIVAFRSYDAVIEAEADGRVDIVVHSASTYVAAKARCRCLDAVAVPKAMDGATHFYAIAIARKIDRVAGLSDLAGRPVAFGDRESTASHRVPAAVLGLDGATPSGFFSSTEVYDNHVLALEALLDRRIDAVFTWSSLAGDFAGGYSRGPLRRAVESGRVRMSDIDIVWRSPPIPHGPVTIRSAVPDDLKSALRDVLMNLYAADTEAYLALEPWFGFGFERPRDHVFEEFATLLGFAGSDIPATAGPDQTGGADGFDNP